MNINSVNNTNEADIAPSIAKKTKAKKNDFTKFLQELGKTDKQTKDSANNSKILDKSTNNDKILSNLLDNKSTNSKTLDKNITKNINNDKLLSNLLDNKSTAIDKLPSQKTSTSNKNIQNINFDNEIQIKTKDDILSSLLQNKQQKAEIKSSENSKTPLGLKTATSNDMKSMVKNTVLTEDLKGIEPNQVKEDLEENKILNKDSNILNSNLKTANIDAKDLIKDTNETKDSTDLNNKSPDTAIIEPKETSKPMKFSTLSKDEIKIPLKDTLKYGTFKAFDALSLLKPSDGKKISDLIKKADELALNLTKIQIQNSKESSPLKETIAESLEFKNDNLKNQISNQKDNILKENTDKDLKIPPEVKTETKKDETIKNAPKNANQDLNKDILKDTLNNNSKDSPNKQAQNNQAKTESVNEQNNNQNNAQLKEDLKPVSFKQNERREIKNDEIKSNNNEKPTDSINANNIKNEQMQKIFDTKETMRGFVNQLRQEIINYKPPLSKITLELNPANLGSVEVSITHQGKNIQVQLNANQNTINLFIQNQSDLRAALSQIGYDNITMSFSNGSQMGFSDNKGNWNYQNNPNKTNPNTIDNEESDMANLEITIVNNYA